MKCLTKNNVPNMDLKKCLSAPFAHNELKIGIDTGIFLCHMADIYRERFFVGIEVKSYQSKIAANRAWYKSLFNVRVVNMEAFEYISSDLVDDCVFSAIHIYFPTPWPRSINLSHRLICPEFVDGSYRILKPGGALRIVTDRKDYYDYACKCFNALQWEFVDWQRIDLGQSEQYLVGTPCEIGLREEGNVDFYPIQMIRL